MSDPDKPALGRPKLDDEQRRARLRKRYPGMLERLGCESDNSIAKDFGITRARVGVFRRQLGISAFGSAG